MLDILGHSHPNRVVFLQQFQNLWDTDSLTFLGSPAQSTLTSCFGEVPALRVSCLLVRSFIWVLSSVDMVGMCLPHRLQVTLASFMLNNSISSMASLHGFFPQW